MTNRPIFVGGMFKSGTSLVRAMLGQHSRIASGLETYWFDVPLRGPEDALDREIEKLSRFFELPEGDLRAWASESRTNAAFLDRLMTRFAEHRGKPRWAEKTPGNVLHLSEIFDYWPLAQVVHVVRDPRDVLASLRQARKRDDLSEFSALWCSFFGAVDQFTSGHPGLAERILEVRYECIVAQPAESMAEVLRFLGEPWEQGVASFSGRPEEFEKVKQVTGKESTTLDRLADPLSKKRIGIWEAVLTRVEVTELQRLVTQGGCGHRFRELVGT